MNALRSIAVLVLATALVTSARAADAPLQLKLATLDGGSFDLAAERGRWVVVNYWATWCAPCIKEIPDLSALDRRREDLVVLGLAFEEIERADLDAFLAQHKPAYPIALVDVYDPPATFDVPRGLPTTYLVAPGGRLAKRYLGPVTGTEIEAEIARQNTSAAQ
jgi:thiol-disulfide isomerase/thioredoxin